MDIDDDPPSSKTFYWNGFDVVARVDGGVPLPKGSARAGGGGYGGVDGESKDKGMRTYPDGDEADKWKTEPLRITQRPSAGGDGGCIVKTALVTDIKKIHTPKIMLSHLEDSHIAEPFVVNPFGAVERVLSALENSGPTLADIKATNTPEPAPTASASQSNEDDTAMEIDSCGPGSTPSNDCDIMDTDIGGALFASGTEAAGEEEWVDGEEERVDGESEVARSSPQDSDNGRDGKRVEVGESESNNGQSTPMRHRTMSVPPSPFGSAVPSSRPTLAEFKKANILKTVLPLPTGSYTPEEFAGPEFGTVDDQFALPDETSIISLARFPPPEFESVYFRPDFDLKWFQEHPHVIVWCPYRLRASATRKGKEPPRDAGVAFCLIPLVVEYAQGCDRCSGYGRACVRVLGSPCLVATKWKQACRFVREDTQTGEVYTVPRPWAEVPSQRYGHDDPLVPSSIETADLHACWSSWMLANGGQNPCDPHGLTNSWLVKVTPTRCDNPWPYNSRFPLQACLEDMYAVEYPAADGSLSTELIERSRRQSSRNEKRKSRAGNPGRKIRSASNVVRALGKGSTQHAATGRRQAVANSKRGRSITPHDSDCESESLGERPSVLPHLRRRLRAVASCNEAAADRSLSTDESESMEDEPAIRHPGIRISLKRSERLRRIISGKEASIVDDEALRGKEPSLRRPHVRSGVSALPVRAASSGNEAASFAFASLWSKMKEMDELVERIRSEEEPEELALELVDMRDTFKLDMLVLSGFHGYNIRE